MTSVFEKVQDGAAGLPQGLELLTEQLIKYAKDDAFFNLHWDIDAQTTGAPLPSGNPSELGPGCVIAALNLQSDATVMLQPRYTSVIAPPQQQQQQQQQLHAQSPVSASASALASASASATAPCKSEGSGCGSPCSGGSDGGAAVCTGSISASNKDMLPATGDGGAALSGVAAAAALVPAPATDVTAVALAATTTRPWLPPLASACSAAAATAATPLTSASASASTLTSATAAFTQPPAPAQNPTRKVKVELKHGDLYLISGAARWEWLHGVSLHPDAALEGRRAVVWRFKAVV